MHLMGGQNGCCATPCSFKPEEMANAITIWGDLFNQDTRALLIICEMAGAPHRFKLVDTFAKQNLEPEYEQMNPNRSIPIITQKAGYEAPGMVAAEEPKVEEKAKEEESAEDDIF